MVLFVYIHLLWTSLFGMTLKGVQYFIGQPQSVIWNNFHQSQAYVSTEFICVQTVHFIQIFANSAVSLLFLF